MTIVVSEKVNGGVALLAPELNAGVWTPASSAIEVDKINARKFHFPQHSTIKSWNSCDERRLMSASGVEFRQPIKMFIIVNASLFIL